MGMFSPHIQCTILSCTPTRFMVLEVKITLFHVYTCIAMIMVNCIQNDLWPNTCM